LRKVKCLQEQSPMLCSDICCY